MANGSLLQRWRGRRLARALPTWDDAPRHGHIVQFYGGPFPAHDVGRFLRQGLDAGEVVVAVVTPAHARLLRPIVDKCGPCIFMDVDETLSRVMVDGWPDPMAFLDAVGDVVAQAAEHGNGRVRAFGEMVVRLCEQGNPEGAAALERLWNDLGQRHTIKLLCSYPVSVVSGKNKHLAFALRDAHTHATPTT